jgi:hypothetical protein
MGIWKIVPIELRTARRKKGLLQVSPTMSACALNAAQFRTSAPRFSALTGRRRRQERGWGLRATTSASVGIGNFPPQQALIHREPGGFPAAPATNTGSARLACRAAQSCISQEEGLRRRGTCSPPHDFPHSASENALLPELVLRRIVR